MAIDQNHKQNYQSENQGKIMRIFRIIVINFEMAFRKGLCQYLFKLKFRRKCSLSVICSVSVNTKHQCYVYSTPWSISPAYWWLQGSKLNSLLLHKTKNPVAKDSQNRWVSELFFSGTLQYSFHSHPEHTVLIVSNDISPHFKSETQISHKCKQVQAGSDRSTELRQWGPKMLRAPSHSDFCKDCNVYGHQTSRDHCGSWNF